MSDTADEHIVIFGLGAVSTGNETTTSGAQLCRILGDFLVESSANPSLRAGG